MPRVAKPKAAAGKAVKKNKLYAMPEKLKEGTILTDLTKTQWRVGSSIGIGGFGEIYSACRVGEKNFDYVVKCEPHANGPLFVEQHFYLRNAKLEDIKQFKQTHGLKSFGMPYLLGNGSTEINGLKHRFIIIPRYGSDIQKFFVENGNQLPEATVYRLAIQMLSVYQFIHSAGYVHADLKAANILLGLGKGGNEQAYLVDFGLASHFKTDYIPDPKKMHNGTIEYTSRDAHQGVATRRSDLEILGYNLIEWLGVVLPWVKDKLLPHPVKVEQAKIAFMSDVGAALKQLFPKGVPAAISDYMKYVAKIAHNETPDYDKCRAIFVNALKQMKVPNTGDLNLQLKPQSNNNSSPGTSKSRAKPANNKKNYRLLDDSDDVVAPSDDDDDDIFEPENKRVKSATLRRPKISPPSKSTKVSPKTATTSRVLTSKKRLAGGTSPIKRSAATKTPPSKRTATDGVSPRKRAALESPAKGTPNAATPKASGSSQSSAKGQTPSRNGGGSASINFSPALSIRAKHGKTIINDNLTPNPRSTKTYEFNFELDVSQTTNVIVNVKRKKKTRDNDGGSDSKRKSPQKTPSRTATNTSSIDSPVTRVKLRKVASEESPASVASHSPRTPAVTIRKFRH